MSYTSLGALFRDIADAIRSKTGSADPIVAENFPAQIESIITTPAGWHDTSQVNAVAGDVLSGKKIVDANGNVLTGTISSEGAAIYNANTTEQTLLLTNKYIAGDQKIAAISFENLAAEYIKRGISVKVKSGFSVLQNVTGSLDVPNCAYEWAVSGKTIANHEFGHRTGPSTITGETKTAYAYSVPAGKTPKVLFWKSNFSADDVYAHGCAWNLDTAQPGETNNAYGNYAMLEGKTFVNNSRDTVYIPSSDGIVYYCVIFV